jgi:LDH2 family malate/lactate/ureidoglycolate dehydrogenase
MNTVISSCRQGRILSGNLVLLAGRLVRDYIQVSINELNAFLTGIFEQYGFGHADAGFITSTLIDADQRGIASHGVQRMSMYDHKLRHHMITPQAHAVVISDVKACAVVDGNSGMGQLISRDAMNLAIAKARTHGVGIVSVRNSNHFGTAGFYARMAADQGFIGVASTNSNPLTVPTHAQSPAIGSNPIAFAVGSGSDQIVYDAATSTVSLGKIELLAKLDKPIEGEWALSENGSVEHSADAVMERMHAEPRTGGLTPLGGAGELNAGYKGYGLGLIVEILTAILSSGTLSLNMHGQHICHCFAAINAEAFGGGAAINERVADLAHRLRTLPSSDGHDVLVPGDKERIAEQHNSESVSVDAATCRQLARIGSRAAIAVPRCINDAVTADAHNDARNDVTQSSESEQNSEKESAR